MPGFTENFPMWFKMPGFPAPELLVVGLLGTKHCQGWVQHSDVNGEEVDQVLRLKPLSVSEMGRKYLRERQRLLCEFL